MQSVPRHRRVTASRLARSCQPRARALALYRAIPDAELAVIPGTSHGLLVEKPDLCNSMVIDFLTNDPVPTFAPIRRASA